MANALKYSAALKNARLDCLASAIGGGGLLRIYNGAQPAGPDAPVTTQTKLAELPCDAGAFAGAASGGVLTANAIGAANALVSGTATWFRLCKSDGTPVIDGSVGASAADLVLDNISLAAGQSVSVAAFAITSGN